MIRIYSPELGGEVKIAFQHNRLERPVRVPFTDNAYASGMTQCILGREDMILATGAAWCSKDDNFDKETGRTLSLARALTMFPADIAEEIFYGYENRDRTNTGKKVAVTESVPVTVRAGKSCACCNYD